MQCDAEARVLARKAHLLGVHLPLLVVPIGHLEKGVGQGAFESTHSGWRQADLPAWDAAASSRTVSQ